MFSIKLQQIKRFATTMLLFASCTFVALAQQTGRATYYGKKMNGARTASGERLNNDSMVCAHRTHPFGTLLKVRHLGTGKEIVVRVIDRGPFGKGMVIDLSNEAARRLGILAQGTAMVELTVVTSPAPPKEGGSVPQTTNLQLPNDQTINSPNDQTTNSPNDQLPKRPSHQLPKRPNHQTTNSPNHQLPKPLNTTDNAGLHRCRTGTDT